MLCIASQRIQALLGIKNAVIKGVLEKESKPGDPRDGFFYPTLTLMIDYYINKVIYAFLKQLLNRCSFSDGVNFAIRLPCYLFDIN